MNNSKTYTMSFAKIFPIYVAKAERNSHCVKAPHLLQPSYPLGTHLRGPIW